MKELEEGEELCPICSEINNPGALEFGRNHFVAMQLEGQLHWTNPKVDELITEIESIQEIIADNEHLFEIVDDKLYDILNPDFNLSHDILIEMLPSNQIKYGDSEGGGSTIYMENVDALDEIMFRLKELKQRVISLFNEKK